MAKQEANHCYFANPMVQNRLQQLVANLHLHQKPFTLTIRSFNRQTLMQLAQTIFNLQTKYETLIFLTKNTIAHLLQDFLPFSFFLHLSEAQALGLKQELLAKEAYNLFVYGKKRTTAQFAIISWTEGFYEVMDLAKIQINSALMLPFVNHYLQMVNRFAFHSHITSWLQTNKTTQLIYQLPLLLFENLQLEQAIYLVYLLNQKFPNLPVDLLIVDQHLVANNAKIIGTAAYFQQSLPT